MFGCSIARISTIVNAIVRYIAVGWRAVYEDSRPTDAHVASIVAGARAVFIRDHPHLRALFERADIIGAGDGSTWNIARPGDNDAQYAVYNMHDHFHCLKTMTVVTFDGIATANLWPCSGGRHDSPLYFSTHVVDSVARHRAVVLMDKAFHEHPTVLRVERRALSLRDRGARLLNKFISKRRVKVEHMFGVAAMRNPSVRYAQKMQMLKSPVAHRIVSSMLLTNVAVMLGRNVTMQSVYNIAPPHILEYFDVNRFDEIAALHDSKIIVKQ
jgi:hypothetical protein